MTDEELLKELHLRVSLGQIELFTGSEGAIFFSVLAQYTEMIPTTKDEDSMYEDFMANQSSHLLQDIARRARDTGV